MNSKLVKLLSDVFEMKEIEITIDLVKDENSSQNITNVA